MKRIAAVLVVVVGVALVVLWKCGPETRPNKPAATAGSGPGPTLAGSTAGIDRPPPSWFGTRGAPARRIAGRVTHRGQPVKDAVVSLQSMLSRARTIQPLVLRSGADGGFDFGLRPAAPYDVTAFSSGTTPAIVQIDLADPTLKPASDQLELRLRDCAASVEGTIYDASGNPLAKGHVRMNGLVGVDADAKGAYKLCVPFADVELEYGADGYGSVVLTVNARGEMRRDVVLVPEASITVRVLRGDTNAPVPEAHVVVFPKEWGPDRPAMASGITGEDGRVRIDRLVPATYRVNGFADGLQSQSTTEALAEVGGTTEVTLRLGATAQISGKVMSGKLGIAGVKVQVIRKSPSMRSPPAPSQADGSFLIDRAPVGELVFLAPPYEVTKPAQLETEAGKRHDNVIVEVRALAAIRGRVTRLGKPVEGADICCARTIVGWPPRAISDWEGKYEFVGVMPGTYQIGGGSDQAGAFNLGTKVTVAAGEERVLDLELDQAGAIAGTVVDGEGRPVKGVFVRWIHEKTGDLGRSITDAQGRYRCGAMTGGGKYQAAVFPSAELQVPYPTADGSPYPKLEVKDGKTVIEDVKLAIDRAQLAIKGRVVDDLGAPVADVVVKALPAKDGGSPQFHSWLRLPLTSTDDDGQFQLAELAPGKYAIQARALDGAEGIAPPVAAGSSGVTVRIERPGTVAGKLVAYSQPPVVYAQPLGAFKLVSGVVDGETFRVTGLRPGRYLVNAQTTYEGDAHVVEVRAGETASVVMTSKGKGTIEGAVLDFRTRAPIANAACHVVMAVDGQLSITNWDLSTAPKSDSRGRVLLDPSPAGSVGVSCEMPVFRWSPPAAVVSLAAGGRASVQLFSVEMTQENSGETGLDLDWRAIAPRVMAVDPKSPAAQAGVLPGDLVTEVNGVSVQGLNSAGVGHLIASTPIGDEVRLVVVRSGATRSFAVKVQPDSAGY